MKKLLFFLPLLFLLPHSAYAAIAFDSAAQGVGLSVNQECFSQTVSGSNTLLFVSSIATSGGTLTTATYNGVSMTQIGTTQTNGSGTSLALYYLINPATGSHNVCVNSLGTPAVLAGDASSYTGALQSGVPDAQHGATGTGTTISNSVTVVGSNAWIVTAAINDADASASSGTNYLQRAPPGASSSIVLGDSNGTVGTGSQNVSFTINSGSPNWSVISASFLPVPTPATPTSTVGLVKAFWIN